MCVSACVRVCVLWWLQRMSPQRFRFAGPGTVSFSWLSLWGGRAIISLDNSPILIPASRPLGLVSLAEKICIQNIFSLFILSLFFSCCLFFTSSTICVSFSLPFCVSSSSFSPGRCRAFYYNCQKEYQFYCGAITTGCFTHRSPEQLKSVNKATHDASVQTMESRRKCLFEGELWKRVSLTLTLALSLALALIN